ncbi:hypothetical protein Mbo2_038 [Rhodococcus phage Mbo2]|uniref:Uncharacterized protein n=1 Tax=Rhodococcus phage Mbo2 TaxID=2936911 RepID=A0A9E7LH76_9CAUD|nr:hypothetical protein Mbo2_038 [Rhodococcus phage Mbo2]
MAVKAVAPENCHDCGITSRERFAAMDKLHKIEELVTKFRTHPAMSATDCIDQIEDVIEE